MAASADIWISCGKLATVCLISAQICFNSPTNPRERRIDGQECRKAQNGILPSPGLRRRQRWTNELRLVYADGRTLTLTETPAKPEGDADAECTPEARVPAPCNNDWPAAKLWVIPLFDRRAERVHVHVYDFPHSPLARILVLGWRLARARSISSCLVDED